ncbi:hypothetical protein VTK73DRAFT_5563 [Phialemonium thermophilum]|uniref:O-methyltransferase C-terminal domain-containing protein n=1 Tax=Phialemonium thermophilum TaxID=223376 RepID=A0ABR3XY10_9PEZI
MPDSQVNRLDKIRSAAEELNAAVADLRSDDPSKAQLEGIVEIAQRIVSAARDPADQGLEVFRQISLITANRLFWEWGVFDEIPREGSISYRDLAARVAADVNVLSRIGGVLVSSGVLDLVDSDRLAHTPHSLIFTKGEQAGFVYQMAWDNGFTSYAQLPRYFEKYGRNEPQTENHVPVTFAAGAPELTYWELLQQDPPRMERFIKAMAPLEASMPITGIYDFATAIAAGQANGTSSDRILFVDVGGGKGHAIKAIHGETPSLPLTQFVLQDRPEVIKTVEELDDPGLRDVKKMAINFHQSQPIQGALIYFIRRCLHNYSDKAATNILRRLVEAMADDSKVLLQEEIMSSPPNRTAAMLDLMMLNFGGKQRTLDCWTSVVSAAGLRISGVFRAKEAWSSLGVIECVKAGN